MFYKDRPSLATENKYPKPEIRDAHGKITTAGPSSHQQFNSYKLRKNHVEKSQEVPFCTNLHIDFLQSSR